MTEQHYVNVGGELVPATPTEWFFATLPENTPVEWEGGPTSGCGVFLFSWWYDGVVAEIDQNGKRVALHPALHKGLTARVCKDVRRLCLQGSDGDGI